MNELALWLIVTVSTHTIYVAGDNSLKAVPEERTDYGVNFSTYPIPGTWGIPLERITEKSKGYIIHISTTINPQLWEEKNLSQTVIPLNGTEPELPPGCPCRGELNCTCNKETGEYSYSDGCNSHLCNVNGICFVTALFCNRDWRVK